MQFHYVTTRQAPAPVGPYSQAVVAGELIFCSGQIALDPADATLAATTVRGQTARVMANLAAVLASQGLTLLALVKTTVFLTSMDHYAEFNAEYEKALEGHKPARSVVEVGALPKGALVEVEGIACR